MVDPRVMNKNRTGLDEASLEELQARLRGQLLRRGDDGYEAARQVWNGMIDKHPAAIVRCTGVADVMEAVNFARTGDIVLAVRGGGHNVAGKSTCDDGLVIDLSPMKGIRVDSRRQTAHAQPGLTWGEFDRETQVFGLATTGGVISSTGIAGLTLGGGVGWLAHKYGLSCDNLLSVDIVTAEGQFLTASDRENADLFWGVRGGGGNFGIVTTFEYQLHPVSQVFAGMVIHPFEKATEVLKFYRDYSSTIPDEMNTVAAVLTSPDGNPVVAIAVCYYGAVEDGKKVLKPFREFGPPLADQIGLMDYTQAQSMLDDSMPAGLRSYWKSDFMKEISDETIDTFVSHCASVPSPRTAVILQQFGGAVSRVGENQTAFRHRDGEYDFVIFSLWSDSAEDEANISWTREFWERMQDFSLGGVYVNDLGEEGEDRVKAAYGASYERLVELKNKYDPTNLFRPNQNIRPTV